MTQYGLGLMPSHGGAAEAALTSLGEARRRFQQLVAASDPDADLMAGVALSETGNYLRCLGRWEKAADAY